MNLRRKTQRDPRGPERHQFAQAGQNCCLPPVTCPFSIFTLHSSTHVQDFTRLKASSDPGTQGPGLQHVLSRQHLSRNLSLNSCIQPSLAKSVWLGVTSDVCFPSGLATGAGWEKTANTRGTSSCSREVGTSPADPDERDSRTHTVPASIPKQEGLSRFFRRIDFS